MPAASGAETSFVEAALGLACGVLGWRPEDFWRATPLELAAALEGFCRFHGIKRGAAFGEADAKELRALLDQQIARESSFRSSQ